MWRVLGGSVVGRAHVAKSLPCQDASAWLHSETLTCLAIADGAGSRAHSHAGAQAAVGAIVDWASSLVDDPGEGWAGDAFAIARESLEEAARAIDAPPEELACTLAGVIATEHAVFVGQLGDGLVFVREDDQDTRVVQPSDRGEYINETTFLTSPDWTDELRATTLPGAAVNSIALSTDGLQFEILSDVQTAAPYAPFFKDVFSWADSEDADSDSLVAFIERLDDQTGDDKTLLIAVRLPSTPEAQAPRCERSREEPTRVDGPNQPDESR